MASGMRPREYVETFKYHGVHVAQLPIPPLTF
jgi:hypothetical protein